MKIFFSMLFNEIFTRPVYNLLIIFLAIFGGNLGISIILLTIGIRALMLRSTLKTANMQKGMGNIQEKIEALQKKYENDPQKLSEETLKVFKSEGKNPFKGCLTMLIQLPVFIGLYSVIRDFAGNGISEGLLYSFFRNFGEQYLNINNIDTNFLGLDLLQNQYIIPAIIVAILNFCQMKLTQITQPKPKKNPAMANMPDMSKMMGIMSFSMAIMMGVLVYTSPSAIGIYLMTTSCFSILQYCYQYRTLLKIKWNEFRGKTEEPEMIEPKQ